MAGLAFRRVTVDVNVTCGTLPDMYPFLRLPFQFWLHRKSPALGLFDTHVSHHICWPWDLDPWMELNNGRTLTLYDMGRLPLAMRVGLIGALRKNRWGLTMAGASVRYRRRVRAFERVEMRSRAVGWDDRFLYLEQSMWKRSGECANHILYRSAVTSADGPRERSQRPWHPPSRHRTCQPGSRPGPKPRRGVRGRPCRPTTRATDRTALDRPSAIGFPRPWEQGMEPR